MSGKTLKPPYYNLTATCSTHGQVTVQRKPNPKAGQKMDSGCVVLPHPMSIVCPHPGCGYQFKVDKAELMTSIEEVRG